MQNKRSNSQICIYPRNCRHRPTDAIYVETQSNSLKMCTQLVAYLVQIMFVPSEDAQFHLASSAKTLSLTKRQRRRRTVSLRVVAVNDQFDSPSSPTTLNYVQRCLRIRSILPKILDRFTFFAENAQFHSVFSAKTLSLTKRLRRRRAVSLHVISEYARYDPKTRSYEDNAKLHYAFSETAHSYATRFRRKRGVIENFEYHSKFEKDFRKNSISWN